MQIFLRMDWCQHLIVYANCVAHRSGDDAVLELVANFGICLLQNTANPGKLRSSNGVDDSFDSFNALILASVSETFRRREFR